MREVWEKILYKDAVNKVSTAKHKLKQKEYLPKGTYPVVDQGQSTIGGYTENKKKLLDCNLPVIVFGDHTKKIKLINFLFAPGADGAKVLEPKIGINPKFISALTEILVFKIKNKGYPRHYQHIEKQYIPLPSIPEQRTIITKIESRLSVCDKVEHSITEGLEKAEALHQSVLKKAFDGKLLSEAEIEKCRKEADYEPASELLKKITNSTRD